MIFICLFVEKKGYNGNAERNASEKQNKNQNKNKVNVVKLRKYIYQNKV